VEPSPLAADPLFANRLVASMDCGVLAIDASGAIVACNDTARRLLGAERGSDDRLLLAREPGLARALSDTLRSATTSQRSELVLCSTGQKLGYTACPVRGAGGRLCGAALLFRAVGSGPVAQDPVEKRRGGATPELLGELPVGVVARSASMRHAVEVARRVGPTPSTVLITGETGTGKEVVADLLHASSRRADQPFVKVNCAALPEGLLESELFGHERGAFTGADRQRIGRFEQASGGTLLLDEVGDMSIATQAKLLRVLQDQHFHRLGSVEARHADVRLIAASHRDLEAAVREGSFREDLYFRLQVIEIHLQPLRERPEDVAALAEQFVVTLAASLERPSHSLGPDAMAKLLRHGWPGNVRELRNCLERALLMSRGPVLGAEDVILGDPGSLRGDAGPGRAPLESAAARLSILPEGMTLAEMERELVVAALERTGFVQKAAARLLGVSRRKLNYIIRRLGLTHPTWRRNRPEDDPDLGAEGETEYPGGSG